MMFGKLNLLNRDESILQIAGLYRSAPIGCNPVTPNIPECDRIWSDPRPATVDDVAADNLINVKAVGIFKYLKKCITLI